MNYSEQNAKQAVEYLTKRGIPETAIEQLGIHHVDYETATSEHYGYGKAATSPDGLIVFPLRLEEVDGELITVARNFYATEESKQQHLDLINKDLRSRGKEQEKQSPKYILPVGDRLKDYPFYDPFSLLHPSLNGSTPEPLLCTEDTIGVIKAALREKRVLSSFGVWLCKRDELEDYLDNPSCLHPFQGHFPVYLVDSDALTKASVFQALVRTGYVIGCRVGMFPSGADGSKRGLDEAIDDGLDLSAISESAVDVADFVHQYLPEARQALEAEHGKAQGSLKAGKFHRQIGRELARHLDDFTNFKTSYGSLFKQLGFNADDLNQLFVRKRSGPRARLQISDTACLESHGQHLPTVQLDPGRLNSILSEIESGLSSVATPRDATYVQGNHDGFYLSRVLKATPDNRSHLIEISKDVDTLDLLTPESLQYELNRRFRFERYDARKEDYNPVDCPRIVSSQFLQKGRWEKLPRLTGISYIPLLCKDGTVISQPGYHKPTGMLLQFDPDEFPAIPDKPTKEDAISALGILTDWLKEFPFQTEIHRSAALSAVLTAACRKLLKQSPLHAISATKAGSGKGTLCKGISILSIDNHAGVIPFTGDSEEFRKKITSFLKSGQPIGLIDNVTGVLGGDVLEMVLTEPFFRDRLLGGNQMPSLSTQVLLLANGNNLRFRTDMIRRTILCVLDSELENPEHRIFDRDFEQFTRANRGMLVTAALTILRAYIVAGYPDRKQPRLGSFEDWSDLVRSSLVWLGLPDPVETQAEIRAQDDERQTLLALLQSWYDSYTSVPQTAREICVGAIQKGSGDLRDILLEVALDRKGDISPRKLGYYLRSHYRSVINGLRFETAGEDRLGATRWKVTVLHQSPKLSPASPAQTAETTQGQAFSDAGDKNLSPAFTRNGVRPGSDGGHPEDATMQEIKNLSPAPPNNVVPKVCGVLAGDAGDDSSGPNKIVTGSEKTHKTSNAPLSPGTKIRKRNKSGWIGVLKGIEGNRAQVLWHGDSSPVGELLSDLEQDIKGGDAKFQAA